MTDPLEKLFGSSARVKLLRLFLFNPRQFFTTPAAAARTRVTERTVRKELKLFCEVKLVRRASVRRRSGARYGLNENFQYLATMQQLLLNAPAQGEKIHDYLRKAGQIKLIVLSGVFVGEFESALDLFVVGERVKENTLRTLVRKLESELGKEIRFVFLQTDDFVYRLNMGDKLVRDVLDYPHKVVFDRLHIALS